MSKQEMETAKKHFRETAEQKCKCEQVKANKDSKPEEFTECVQEYERRVRYMTSFFDVVKPSDAERKEAAKAGDEVAANCKIN